jgi:hypothetical protein
MSLEFVQLLGLLIFKKEHNVLQTGSVPSLGERIGRYFQLGLGGEVRKR